LPDGRGDPTGALNYEAPLFHLEEEETRMRPKIRIASGLAVAAVAIVYAGTAFAQTTGGTGTTGFGDSSFGSKLYGFLTQSTAPVFVLLAGISWLCGLFLIGTGLAKLAGQAEHHGHRGESAGALVRIVAGLLLFAMPDVAGIGISSITGGITNIFGSSAEMAQISQSLDVENGSGSGTIANRQSNLTSILQNVTVTAPRDCLASMEGVSCMAENVAKNFVPIGVYTIYILCFLSGAAMFMSCLWALSRAYGHHGQGIQQGFWAKVLTALILMNSPWLIAMFATTLNGAGGVLSDTGFNSSSSLLSYSFMQTGQQTNVSAQLQKFQDLIGYLMTILAFFGVWAFFRGVFVCKASAEGKSGSSYGHGVVFMVGGVLLANAKLSICATLFTFGGQTMTFGFCN
jgi:hypothetical protein